MSSPRTLVSRRTALRTVIAGAVGVGPLGCQSSGKSEVSTTRLRLAAENAAAKTCPVRFAGERFDQPHAKRDGRAFPQAQVSENVEIAIIGGGPSGLCALHALKGRDAVLLEKEDELGGNCTSDTWEGVTFSTGAAFFTAGDAALVELMRSIGAPPLPIEGGDVLVVGGEPFADFFGNGARRLPFEPSVRDAFRLSAERAEERRRQSRERELDVQSFSEFLRPYPAELRVFWDRFGASNWGATAEHTSARLGLSAYAWLRGEEEGRLSYPGGLGAAASALGAHLSATLAGQVRTSTFTHELTVEAGGRSVLVHTLSAGEPRTIRARRVIVAVPKFFAARMLPQLGAEQRAAMSAFRYAPYPVFNVCLNDVGPELAYDSWFLDAPFCDIIPADWVLFAGRGPKPRKTALTVYHPLLEGQRAQLLDDERLVQMSDDVVLHLDRHFPGLRGKVAETRVYRRGHALPLPAPGQLARAELASRTFGPIAFAHSDSRGDVSAFAGALRAAHRAIAELG
ncbi:MAG: amine oxidase [Polyangiaceae bacterium]|nr:amine oxidase [Polyangiaceae bacterium]